MKRRARPLGMDDDLLTFLGEAAVELRLPPDDSSAGIAAKAMLAVEHRSISQVLAWDLGRLKNGTGLVDRADKLAYVAMLKGPDGDQLGDSPAAANLVGLVVDRVALTCKEPTAAVSVATSPGKGEGAEDVAERKKANDLYEDYGKLTGIRLELGMRDRHVASLHRNYKEHHQLGGFISYSDVSTLGVKKKREQRVSLGGATGSATLVLEEGEIDQKGRTDEEARNLAYIVVMVLVVSLTQEIPADLYPGSESSGYEEVPGRGRRRLGLTFNVREQLMRSILVMGGEPQAYLTRVDRIMDRIVNEIDERTRHPDTCIRDFLHKYGDDFVLARPTAAMKGGGGPSSSGASAPAGGVRVGWCPGWVDEGKCRAPGGESKCAMKHPSDKRGIGRKSSGGKGSNPKGGKFPKTQPAAKADDA